MNLDTQRNARPPHRRPATPDWRSSLPAQWADYVIEALDFAEHVEYEMPARRILGHDADGELCFYAHDYVLTENRSDNDEDFYTVVTAGESVRAWRLVDARWLIFRQPHGDEAPGRPFYSFSDRPPR